MSTWIGIDPGRRWGGVVAVRDRDDIVVWSVTDRGEGGELDPYLERTEAAVYDAISACGGTVDGIALEDVAVPKGFADGKKRFVKPEDLVELALAVGWMRRAFSGAVRVPPDGNGSRPWHAYPEALMTARERVNARRRPLATAGQSSDLRHVRSAYDVARRRTLTGRRPA